MRKIKLFLLLLLGVNLGIHAQKLSFDEKYVKVGVLVNEWPALWENNPNLRNLGTLHISSNGTSQQIEARLNEQNVGKRVLDILFQRDNEGLHMDRLYDQALQNTTIEEIEVAIQDASAETKDVLKKEISRQILKSNYVVVFQTISWTTKRKKTKTKKFWHVFHIDINDRIIDQAFLNWENPENYNLIKVPVRFVAKGEVPSKFSYEGELIFDIAKKVPAFAVRGSVYSRRPLLARTTSKQGIKKRDRFFIYRFVENKRGEIYSKKVSTARVTDVNDESTRLFTISGRYASAKRGDVAVLKDRHRLSLSVAGQGSFGDDPRYGGRIQLELLCGFSKTGIAQYFLTNIDYNRYKREPENVWWNEDGMVRPTLQNASFSMGYGIGFNFFGRFELMPYILAGYQISFMTDLDEGQVWNHNTEQWETIMPTKENEGKLGHSFITHGGARLSMNIWYPVQLIVGADYNLTLGIRDGFKPATRQHELDRLNIYAGLRFHF